MKLIRFGPAGNEKPGVILADGTRIQRARHFFPIHHTPSESLGPTRVEFHQAVATEGDEIPNPGNLSMWFKVNGELRQNSSTANMIFDCATLVSYGSDFMTLLPGDVISTGTPAGVGLGMNPPQYLKADDVVELGIQGLGESRQQVIHLADGEMRNRN